MLEAVNKLTDFAEEDLRLLREIAPLLADGIVVHTSIEMRRSEDLVNAFTCPRYLSVQGHHTQSACALFVDPLLKKTLQTVCLTMSCQRSSF